MSFLNPYTSLSIEVYALITNYLPCKCSTESKKVQSLAEKNKAFSKAWQTMDEKKKEEFNTRAKNEEAEKVSSPESKMEMVRKALVKLKEHVCNSTIPISHFIELYISRLSPATSLLNYIYISQLSPVTYLKQSSKFICCFHKQRSPRASPREE